MDEEARAVAYLADRRQRVAARDKRLGRMSGDQLAAERIRRNIAPLVPPYGVATATDGLRQRTDAPEEIL